MSPGEIKALIKIFTLPDPTLDLGETNCAMSLFHDGLLQKDDKGKYQVTDKGIAFVQMLCETPMPVYTWIDPRERERAGKE